MIVRAPYPAEPILRLNTRARPYDFTHAKRRHRKSAGTSAHGLATVDHSVLAVGRSPSDLLKFGKLNPGLRRQFQPSFHLATFRHGLPCDLITAFFLDNCDNLWCRHLEFFATSFAVMSLFSVSCHDALRSSTASEVRSCWHLSAISIYCWPSCLRSESCRSGRRGRRHTLLAMTRSKVCACRG